MSSLEDFESTPELTYSSFFGFSGHLLRGLALLPDGESFVYASGSHVCFNTVQEVRKGSSTEKPGMATTRRTGGGYTAPRERALGAATNDYLEHTVVGSTAPAKSRGAPSVAVKPGLSDAAVADTRAFVPGCFVRPVLVSGHTQTISCLALSPSGNILVTGTVTSYGFAPELIVWDVAERRALTLIRQHKTSITDIAIAPDEGWFVTIGEDNWIVAHSLADESGHERFKAFAGKRLPGNHAPICVAVLPDHAVVVGGEDFLAFYELDLQVRVFRETVVRLPLRRRLNCFLEAGGFLFAGTESGDVVKIDTARRVATQVVPTKKPFPGAVTALAANDSGNLIVATSASKVYLVRADNMVPITINDVPADTGLVSASAAFISAATGTASTAATAAISGAQSNKDDTSPSLNVVNNVASGLACLAAASSGAGEYCLAMGPNCLCRIHKQSLECRLLQTAPPAITTPLGVTSVAFPHDCARIFVSTCGSFLSVWSVVTGRELVRISVPTVRCLCAVVSPDGSQIVSGWSDGAIRAHAPQTGTSLWIAERAHEGGVTSIEQARGGAYVITGGGDGRICLWEVRDSFQRLVQVQKGHTGSLTSLSVKTLVDGDEEMVSTCAAGIVQLFRLTHGQTHNKQDALAAEPVKLEQCWSSRAEGTLAGAHELRDGSQVFCCGSGGMLWLQCGRANGSILRALPLPVPASACSLYEGPDATKILVGCKDGHVFLVDYDTGAIEKKMHVAFGDIRSIAIAADDAVAACAGADGSVAVFSIM